MSENDFLYFYVKLYRDVKTSRMVAEIPALDIAEYGADSDEALAQLQEMAHFHLECLSDEGKPVPDDTEGEEGLYIRVRRPVRAT